MYISTVLILLLTILDIFVYYLQKQYEEDNGDQNNISLLSSLDQHTIHEENHVERKCSTSLSSFDKQCRVFSLAEIKMATHDFNDALVIGKGGFGKVYKGKFDIDVAIKRSNLNSNQGATEFWAEIEMLSKFRHSHIVSLIGYCEEEMILVYEYMPNGSLEDHLHKRNRANGSESSGLTWVQRLNICIGAARGLDYLHTGIGVQRRVIHRDVKSSNILLDGDFAAKVSDFGVSRIGPANQSGTTTNVYTGQLIGTFGYMDAEYFETHRLTRKSDVYAFGVVLFEVLCGRPALDFTLEEQQHSLAGWAKHCIKEGNISQIIDPCLRGQVSAYYLKEFGQIAYKCLNTCSKDRPTMTKVLERLEFVLAKTLQTPQTASDYKHSLRTTFIGKAHSLFSSKATISSGFHIKNLGHSSGNKKKGIMMEKDATNVETEPPESGQTMMPPLKMFKFSVLQRATRNFGQDRIIGEGGFGTVFKGWLDSVTYVPRKDGVGIPVAIKKFNGDSVQDLEMWQAEVKFLGKLSHPNLVKLLGYCEEDNNFLLVHEYMPKGSLEDHLFKRNHLVLPERIRKKQHSRGKQGSKSLSWKTRIKIAMGAAQGLAFLHTKENNVIFRNMKSSYILLDTDFNAKLSDSGLLRAGPVNGESHVSTRVIGTYGFAAPEYIATGHLYMKSDVYGFGAVMLEIITGLRVLDTNRHARKRNLVDWVKPFLHNKQKLQRIIDPRLERDYPVEGIRKTADLILTCLQTEPKHRPSMEEVVSVLQVISATEM